MSSYQTHREVYYGWAFDGRDLRCVTSSFFKDHVETELELLRAKQPGLMTHLTQGRGSRPEVPTTEMSSDEQRVVGRTSGERAGEQDVQLGVGEGGIPAGRGPGEEAG